MSRLPLRVGGVLGVQGLPHLLVIQLPRHGPPTAPPPLRAARHTPATPAMLEKGDILVPRLDGIMGQGREAMRSGLEIGHALIAGTLTLLSTSRWPVFGVVRSLILAL